MPKRNSINLQDLCFQVISDEMEIMKNYLTCLPYILITELYERKDYFGLDVEKLPLEIFLNENTTKLVVKHILLHLPHHKLTDEMYNDTDKCIEIVCQHCSVNSIICIDLSCCNSIKPSLQTKLIEHFHQIQILKVVEFGNDQLLAAIARHCTQLRHLDASFSSGVTNIGIQSLCFNNDMKIVHLDIYEAKVTAKGCLCALKNMKFLKIFIHSCWNELFEMLKLEMHSTQAYSSIEDISQSCCLNEEQLNIATSAFPNVRKLLMGEINFNQIVVRNYLEKVTDLNVESDNIDINLVGLCCPIVEVLQLQISNFTNVQNDWSIPNHTPFKRLRSLELICPVNEIPEKDLSLLLANCHDLNNLNFEYCQTLTDDFFINLLKVNPLYHLRKIFIYGCDNLSVLGLMAIVEMDNFLDRVIISDCELITELESTELQNYGKRNNLNVDVVLVDLED